MNKFKKLLKEKDVDAIWVTNHYNKSYITGFKGSACEVILSENEIYFLTDGRYAEKVKTEIKQGIKIIIIDSYVNYFEAVANVLNKFQKIGVEAENMTVLTFEKLKSTFKNKMIVSLNSCVTRLRIVKSDEEIEKIKIAVDITDRTFEEFGKKIKVGMTELEAQILADELHIKNGADKPSFDTILLSGKNTAFPHGKASLKIIEEGDIITLDFGCYKNGYVSDMTRTFFLGQPCNEELKKIHSIVLLAHEEQIKAVKAGVSCRSIDEVGRNIIASAGYGEYFIHGTGHGIGLEIHEEPYLNKTDETILEENMIITIEPGIYVPNLGGVRIEQDVIVKKNYGIELNASSKHYSINQE